MIKNIVQISFIISIFLTIKSYGEDSLDFKVEKVDSTLISDAILNPPKSYSPLKSVALSALIPGAGQMYCERKVRGGVFLGANLIIGGLTARKYFYEYKGKEGIQGKYIDGISTFHSDSLAFTLAINNPNFQNSIDSLYGKVNKFYYDLQYEARKQRKLYHHFVGWGAGIYLTNILDALSSSKHFYDDKPRKPGLAAGLSAIPGLGLGQMYNGSFQKAGLLLTTHTMLLYMAFDKHKMGNDCLERRNYIDSINIIDTVSSDINSNFSEKWTREYNSVIRDRNMYLWYFVLFYFYGIFDAAVDAHLHDKRVKIRLTPLADPVDKKVSMNLSLDLKSRRK